MYITIIPTSVGHNFVQSLSNTAAVLNNNKSICQVSSYNISALGKRESKQVFDAEQY